MAPTRILKEVKSHYDIVVIGGGISGVSTVYHTLSKLTSNRNKSIAILEARSRLGGRIHTVDLPSKKVEFGAQWIHGMTGNPIYDIAHDHRLVDPLKSEHLESLFHDENCSIASITEYGTKIPLEIIDQVFQHFNLILQKAESFFTTCHDKESDQLPPVSAFDNSMGKYLLAQIETYLKEQNSPDLTTIKGIFRTFILLQGIITGSHSVYDVSLKDIGSYKELPGGNSILENGYESLFKVLLDLIQCRLEELNSAISNCKLQTTRGHNNNDDANGVTFDCLLEHQVINIKWKNMSNNQCPLSSYSSVIEKSENNDLTLSDGKRDCHCYVEVTCLNGTTITANHVVVTVPLGVLKSTHETLFTPNLPQNKVKSISSLGFSVVNKIYLEFKEKLAPKFWDPSIKEYFIIWTKDDDDEQDQEEFSITIKKNSPHNWWRTFYSVTKYSDSGLLFWLSGEEAKFVESLDSQQVGETIVNRVLRKMFDPNFPQPEATFVTKWASDPFTQGSYTYVSTESTVQDLKIFSEPIFSDHGKPIVIFGGETCHPDFYSTVHGAFLSGKTCASCLLECDKCVTMA